MLIFKHAPTRGIPGDIFFNDLIQTLDRALAPKHQLASAHVDENEDHFLVSLALPGFTKDQVNIEFEKGFLTVSSKIDEESQFVKSFEESVFVSLDVDLDKSEATFENGILEIKIFKKEKETKKITIA